MEKSKNTSLFQLFQSIEQIWGVSSAIDTITTIDTDAALDTVEAHFEAHFLGADAEFGSKKRSGDTAEDKLTAQLTAGRVSPGGDIELISDTSDAPACRYPRTKVDGGTAIEECRAEGFDLVEFIAFLSWRVAEAEPGITSWYGSVT